MTKPELPKKATPVATTPAVKPPVKVAPVLKMPEGIDAETKKIIDDANAKIAIAKQKKKEFKEKQKAEFDAMVAETKKEQEAAELFLKEQKEKNKELFSQMAVAAETYADEMEAAAKEANIAAKDARKAAKAARIVADGKPARKAGGKKGARVKDMTKYDLGFDYDLVRGKNAEGGDIVVNALCKSVVTNNGKKFYMFLVNEDGKPTGKRIHVRAYAEDVVEETEATDEAVTV